MHRYLHPAKGTDNPVSVGDVIIHSDNLPRGLWKMGRVQRLIVGEQMGM